MMAVQAKNGATRDRLAYSLYPGCSLERNAAAYRDSLMAIAEPLGLTFSEVDDWNCCGATEYIALDLLPAYALVSRNLALAAEQGPPGTHLVAPCSACFLNLSKADRYLGRSSGLAEKINRALAAGGLHYESGSVTVRHLLDIIVNDVGLDQVAEKVTRPLYDLKIAPYYGCLVVRPAFQGAFDDPEFPTSMDRLLEALGATVVDYSVKAQCCGGHMPQISEEIALRMLYKLLKQAVDHEADVIVTLCPMCQLNLDAYQDAVNKAYGSDFHIPVLYFTQMIGLALGIDEQELGIGLELVDARPALARIAEEPPKVPKQRKPKEALPMPALHEEVKP